ncbi:hypothetical protein IFM89_034274 [Coptis chinensis]|uniref:Prefoldin subunit 3 n=1 Tax=Coptis chinensis TaxID=261450 RepID=A0A835IUE7_9MAGN|nr:hypothetical protein IFM89_034274 [Coptis chinensis]
MKNWIPQQLATGGTVLSRYYFTVARKYVLNRSLPRAINSVLAKGPALITDFEVSEGIYSRARIDDNGSVCLWLGANVMLEYTYEEANSLLQKNLENARASLEVLVDDLQFLRDQTTITQVTIARVYNWDVHQRRSKQVAATPMNDS